jgi:hypothetical protein
MAARPQPLGTATALPQLSFAIEDAGVLSPAATPTLRFALRIEAGGGVPIRSVVLETQIQIAARRRSYDPATEGRLNELFGEPHRWSSTLGTVPWMRTTTMVPPFEGSTSVDLLVGCTYDFDVSASKYLCALPDGEVPLEFLFSGTFFYTAASGLLQTGRIAWDREAEYRLPVATWRAAMDQQFPDSAWLRLGRDAFDRLYAYKARHALTSWDVAVEALLDARQSDEGGR